MTAGAESLLAESSKKVRNLMAAVYDYFVAEAGCVPYVKTIYIGFQLGDAMVAAAYPHTGSVEVALALADDIDGPALIDAVHLTWRSMPVAVDLASPSSLKEAQSHFEMAVERVRSGAHDVELPQERFMGRDRRIANPRILGSRA